MPRLKREVDPMRKVLLGNEITGDEMARLLNASVSTGYRRLADPAELTIRELRRLIGRVPIDELRGAI